MRQLLFKERELVVLALVLMVATCFWVLRPFQSNLVGMAGGDCISPVWGSGLSVQGNTVLCSPGEYLVSLNFYDDSVLDCQGATLRFSAQQEMQSKRNIVMRNCVFRDDRIVMRNSQNILVEDSNFGYAGLYVGYGSHDVELGNLSNLALWLYNTNDVSVDDSQLKNLIVSGTATNVNFNDVTACGGTITSDATQIDPAIVLECDSSPDERIVCNPQCSYPEECEDGIDNDLDGLFDLDDPDCARQLPEIPANHQIICHEDFEGDELSAGCGWNIGWAGTGYTWGTSSARKYTGSQSLWMAGSYKGNDLLGLDALTMPVPYQSGAILLSKEFNLNGATDAYAIVHYWFRPSYHETFFVVARQGAIQGVTQPWQGKFEIDHDDNTDLGDGWHVVNIPLNEFISNNVQLQIYVLKAIAPGGPPDIYRGWLPEGAFIDDIYIVKVMDEGVGQVHEICDNGIDDDSDSFIDCTDSDCIGTIGCQGPNPRCGDGTCNGQETCTSCAMDCANTPECLPNQDEIVLCEEDFEGNFPDNPDCNWQRFWGARGYTWDDDDCRASEGTKSAWALNQYRNTNTELDPCTFQGPLGGESPRMEAGPFNLSDAENAFLTFDYWLRMPPCDDSGWGGHLLVSVNGEGGFVTRKYCGDHSDQWVSEVIDVSSIVGRTDSKVQFVVSSSRYAQDEIPNQAFIDNVKLVKFVPKGALPPVDVCGDGACSASESCSSCIVDCGRCSVARCGDNLCNGYENCNSCEEDCGSCTSNSFCGDNTCDAIEDCDSCERDCGVCSIPEGKYCGDNTCDADENCRICAADCNACPRDNTTTPRCIPHPEICDNDIDDDCDGKVDSRDPSCWTTANTTQNTTRTMQNTTKTIRKEFSAGLIEGTAESDIMLSDSYVQNPPSGTVYAFNLNKQLDAATVFYTGGAESVELFKRTQDSWTKVSLTRSTTTNKYSLNSLEQGDYVLVEKTETQPTPIEIPQSQPFPVLPLVIGLVVLIGIVSFFMLKQRKPEHHSVNQVQQEAPHAIHKPNPKPLEAKRLLQAETLQGKSIDDAKLELVKKGFSPREINQAIKDLKR